MKEKTARRKIMRSQWAIARKMQNITTAIQRYRMRRKWRAELKALRGNLIHAPNRRAFNTFMELAG